ncbi:hypothetical protein FQN57_001158 [Myotisia sp. PD_48]|nr:hypothetical protein FQN57_001158 [Myotisia sp. PD_48]
MARLVCPQVFTHIQEPLSPTSRLEALRILKNEIIGHDQKKQAWIESGILTVLSRILKSGRDAKKSSYKQPHQQRNGKPNQEDETCYQVIIIIGSLALGGPAFISPILAADIISSLLSILSCPNCSQSLTLVILQTLNVIANQLSLALPQINGRYHPLAAHIFTPENIPTLIRILEAADSTPTSQLCVDLTADLLAQTCTEEKHKLLLTECGLLDTLAIKLATFVVADGFVLPGADNLVTFPGSLGYIPSPAPKTAKLAPILRAIATIVEYSRSRADYFLSSPGMSTVFPRSFSEFSLVDSKRGPWKSPYGFGYAPGKQVVSNAIDLLLPSVPIQPRESSNFPALGSQASYNNSGQFFVPPAPFHEQPGPEEPESAIISWLLCIARLEHGYARLMAVKLITVFFRLGFVKEHRVAILGYLLVPVLVKMLDKGHELSDRVFEEAPAILASLVMDCRPLQKFAVDSGAIKKLTAMLKEVPNINKDDIAPMWRPTKSAASAAEEVHPALRLGSPGLTPRALHHLKHREGILKALAALALFTEEYRKTICEAGVVPTIIESMKSWDPAVLAAGAIGTPAALDGYPIPVLHAACAAAKSLTRSVCILRTSLIDAGVAGPVCNLVRHHDVEVQIAATAVFSNLALDFSPMKEDILASNMIPVLCEHARSSNSLLRLESIWALKNVAFNTANDVKRKIVRELGLGWVKQVIAQDTNEPIPRKKRENINGNGVHPIEIGAANAAGEQIDLLNPIRSSSDNDDADFRMADAVMPPKPSMDVFLTKSARQRKLSLYGNIDHSKKLRKDDILVREQALDFLRNIICGSGATEMMDYVFAEFGQTEFLDLLADGLRPKSITSPGRKEFGHMKTIPAPTEIVCAITYLLIHIAAGRSRHRDQLLLHKDILKLMLPMFQHSSWQIRVNCVWVVFNLSLPDTDDKNDRVSVHRRALRLKSLGVLDHLEILLKDQEADVRQRTKATQNILEEILGP